MPTMKILSRKYVNVKYLNINIILQYGERNPILSKANIYIYVYCFILLLNVTPFNGMHSVRPFRKMRGAITRRKNSEQQGSLVGRSIAPLRSLLRVQHCKGVPKLRRVRGEV